MPRKIRIQYPGAIYHVMSRGDRREDIFFDVTEELRRLGWSEAYLPLRLKGYPAKLAMASRLRAEMILPMTWIARRLHLGTAKCARPRLRNGSRHRNARSASPEPGPNHTASEQNHVALL